MVTVSQGHDPDNGSAVACRQCLVCVGCQSPALVTVLPRELWVVVQAIRVLWRGQRRARVTVTIAVIGGWYDWHVRCSMGEVSSECMWCSGQVRTVPSSLTVQYTGYL